MEFESQSPKDLLSSDFVNVPTYRDGISTHGTYLVVATRVQDLEKDVYNCICVGNGKVKFYPNPEYFGIQESDLHEAGISGEPVIHHGYTRYYASREQVRALLKAVHLKRGTIQINPEVFDIAPPRKPSSSRKAPPPHTSFDPDDTADTDWDDK